MNSKLIKEAISQLIDTIKEQVEIINKNDGRIPQIEIDLIMSNIRKLYEEFYLLNKLNSDLIEFSVTDEKKLVDIKPEIVDSGKPKVDKKEIKPREFEKTDDSEKPVEKEETIKETNIVLESIIEQRPEENKEVVTETEPDKEEINLESLKKTEKTKPVFDLFSINEESIADKFVKENDNSVAAKISKKKTSDLKSIIGINEKFLFINELFNGNMHDYNEAVNSLNSFTNHEEASNYIGSLKQNKDWDDNSQAYKILNDFVVQIFN